MVYSIPFQGSMVCRYAPFSKIIIHLVDGKTRWPWLHGATNRQGRQMAPATKKHFGHFQSPSGKSIINGNQIYNTPEVFEYITIYQYSKLEHHHISPSGIMKQIGHFPQYPINLPSIFNSYRKHINMS